MKWTVPFTDHGVRLDVFLTHHLPHLTRSQIAKSLKRGAGLVNGSVASVHQFLKSADVVEFHPSDRIDRTTTQPDKTRLNTSDALHTIKILSETPDWLVIQKPTGLIVHPLNSETARDQDASPTVVDAVLAHDPRIAKVGDHPIRPGIVHRLDKETSGLMVIAKTQPAFDALKHQFAQHAVEKRYIALAYGQVSLDEGDIKFRIARSKTRARMAAVPQQGQAGKAAWTHYKVLRRFRTATLIELTTLSGRTHQIRAHLFAINHPIVGDPLYTRKAGTKVISAPRLMLQSVHLGFVDPTTDETRSFDLPPDKEFVELMNTL